MSSCIYVRVLYVQLLNVIKYRVVDVLTYRVVSEFVSMTLLVFLFICVVYARTRTSSGVV
jgi:hypothetical protein